eukprot:TRINITY_DN1955_c1_g1_i1.p1 TRINITY_DN1955_c1_g1~~TRINITY_DN1955_c1_g1_i1.p1  ORF type:complete len:281 (+),score=73.25 TRINITY_DN1955_c1_g1_i1:119-844(+)
MDTTKIAVVTGGTRGIGYEITKGLAKLKDFRVVFTARSTESGEKAITRLLDEGIHACKVSFFVVDVTEEGGPQKIANHVLDKFGTVHVLINNAGVFLDGEANAAEVSLDIIRQSFEVNTLAPLRFIQAFLPIFKSENYGRIVNVSSVQGSLKHMRSKYTGYRVSKSALNCVTRMIADEVKDFNILVNSMCPGACKTDMSESINFPTSRTAEQGADAAIYLATLPDDGARGMFLSDDGVISW